MLSSLMFLRMGYVVSNAGITGTALMLTIAYIILLCTAFSISALVTNGAVSGGGVYFMISRTLGKDKDKLEDMDISLHFHAANMGPILQTCIAH